MYVEGDEQKENLWASILSEVQNQSAKSLPVRKHLLVLGDSLSGKTQLISALQNSSEIKSGVALEFHSLDIKDDSRDSVSKLSVWVLDGDAYHSNLLKFGLTEQNVAHTLAMIVVNMSEPWYAMESLQQWISVLEKHVSRLKLTVADREKWKNSIVRGFQMYSEEMEKGSLDTKDKVMSTGKRLTAFNALHPEPLDATPANADDKKDINLLEEGILNANFGIPIIVVANKTDYFERLEKEQNYQDEHFDFLQIHLRRFCLKYGAALIYTSVKDRRNCSLLFQYIQQRIYGFAWNNSASIVDRDAIFIPSGWDSPAKINIIVDNLPGKFKTAAFNEIISRPVVSLQHLRNAAATGGGGSGTLAKGDLEVFVEDDQGFLGRMQIILQKPSGSGEQVSAGQDGSSAHPLTHSASLKAEAAHRRVGSGRGKLQSGAGLASPGQVGTSANDGTLANFFNSLLHKRGSGVVDGKMSRTDSVASSRSIRESVLSENDDSVSISADQSQDDANGENRENSRTEAVNGD